MADQRPNAAETARPDHSRRVESSMLWAAWADALGFISELTDERGLTRRTHGRDLTEPVAWNRRVGGKYGVPVDLPAGCYSDDTQLRLAASRAISAHGFDVEAFAKVELTVWPSYALGGGRASKAAAQNLSKSAATWSTNFFPGWTDAGGNGAAMRIQPHVWAAQPGWNHLTDVIRNAVVTHGHPRGIVGAVLHAAALTWALERGRTPVPADWADLLEIVADARHVFDFDPELSAFWKPQWEQEKRRSFDEAWMQTVGECGELFKRSLSPLRGLIDRDTNNLDVLRAPYESLIETLNLRAAENRGSAIATTVAAIVLAATLPEHPAQAAVLASQTLGTDTDTIATMTAAMVAAANPIAPIDPVQDAKYLANEARRLDRISTGRDTVPFPYPDLVDWQPPRNQLESVGIANDRVALAGISYLEPLAEPVETNDAAWTWTSASFGASFLVKHRKKLAPMRRGNWPMLSPKRTESNTPDVQTVPTPSQEIRDVLSPLFDVDIPGVSDNLASATEFRALIELARSGGLNDKELGRVVRQAANIAEPLEFIHFIGALQALIRAR